MSKTFPDQAEQFYARIREARDNAQQLFVCENNEGGCVGNNYCFYCGIEMKEQLGDLPYDNTLTHKLRK